MRLPDPIANTTTEAYLAYKAKVLAEGDLKPKLYEPYIHLDAWLAYWTGLTTTYPVKNVGKNLFDKDNVRIYALNPVTAGSALSPLTNACSIFIPIAEGETFTVSSTNRDLLDKYASVYYISGTPDTATTWITRKQFGQNDSVTTTAPAGATYLGIYFLYSNNKTTIANAEATIQIERGSTATAYEPYSGEPEMLTDEEAYIAYLSGVTDTYPEEFKDPADIRVAAYLRYLISARFGRPEYPVTNEEFYLSLQKPPYVPSGNPSSDIELDDTIKAPFIDVKMYGDTAQKSYEGKNLYNFEPNTAALNGLSVTYDKDTGLIRVSGTPTANWANIGKTVGDALPAGNYILWVDNPNPNYRINLRTIQGGTTIDYHASDGGSSVAFTTTGSISSMYVYIDHNYDLVAIDWSFKLMLETGSTATSFEPYVGGIASPNPDYPQPVQTVTGLQKVEVRGKNLFDIDNYSSAVLRGGGSAVSVAKENSTTLKLTNLISQGSNFCGIPIPNSDKLLGKSVTISGTVELGTGVGDARVAVYAGTSTSVVTAIASKTLSASGSFTLAANIPASYPSGANLIHFVIYGSGNNSPTVNSVVVYSNLQMEIGSATTYEPYSSNDYEINLGKNLLNVKDNLKTSSNGLDFSFSDNKLVVSGTPTVGYANVTNEIDVDLPAGDYTFSISNAINHRVYVRVWYEDSTYTDLFLINAGSTSRTSSLAKKVERIRIDFSMMTVGTAINESFALQLEKGSTATTYAPYFEPIELCKLGTYQDYIWKDDDTWKVHKATGYFDFSGQTSTNGVNKQSATSLGGFVFGAFVNPIPNYANPLIAYSNYFRVENTNSTWTEYGKMGVGSSGALWFKTIDDTHTDDRTVSQFVAWLRDTPVNLYYALATPTDTAITNTALIGQLEALSKGGSEEGTTYIKVSASDPNLPGLLYVEAAEDVD